jgi:hypothetical protein
MRAKANKLTVLSGFGGLFAGWAIHGLFRGDLAAEYHFILYSLYAAGLFLGVFVVLEVWQSYRLVQTELLEKLKRTGEPNPIGISSN